MDLLLSLLIFIFSFSVQANERFYFAASMGPSYITGNEDAASSLLGTNLSLAGGFKLKEVSLEFGGKRMQVSSEGVGSKDYETKLSNSLFNLGARVWLDQVFSLKAGLVVHHLDMTVYKNDTRQRSMEVDGDFLSWYGGMGFLAVLSRNSEFFIESSIYPLIDQRMYFIDIEAGMRFYLY
jgi:hypothetical protein